MSLVINEVLANPVGKDTEGEFIEIYNNSKDSIFLTGYSLADESGKTFNLKGEIEGLEYKVFYYKDTGININNNEEIIYLKKGGEVVDEVVLSGVLEGMSLARVGENFIFTNNITEGAGLIMSEEKTLDNINLIDNASLNSVVITGVLISIIFGFVVWFLYRILTLYE